MAKTTGRYAPDGSVYVTLVPATGPKTTGLYSPDFAIYVTRA